jgi:predicted metal-binding membrane protein
MIGAVASGGTMNDVPHAAVGAGPGMVAVDARQPWRALAILALALLGWLLLVWLVVEMDHPIAQLTMPDSSRWSAANVVAIWVMWSVMMAAMMLPSALPMIVTFAYLSARNSEPQRGYAFVAAYLAVWFAFSALATATEWVLQAIDWINPMIVSTSKALTAALLLIAGVYQFSPLKRACLARCRTPLGFLVGEWRPGLRGAFGMGVRHGLFCLGCCWALMALLFVGGVMNLAWVAALAVAVAIEKLVARGERVATILGLALIGVGCARLLALAQ